MFRLLSLGNPCTAFYLLWPCLVLLQCSCFLTLEYFSCRFRSVVYAVVKQCLLASAAKRLQFVCHWLTVVFVSPYFLPYYNSLHLIYSVCSPLPISFPTCILSSSSASLHLSSAPSGGSVASDAAGRGQPFVSVTGGNLQTTLCQEGHRTRQPHFQILWSSGHCAGQRHTGQPPGMEMFIWTDVHTYITYSCDLL